MVNIPDQSPARGYDEQVSFLRLATPFDPQQRASKKPLTMTELTNPVISIVVETFNLEVSSVAELDIVLKDLAQQTYPASCLEIIIVVDSLNTGLIKHLNSEWPVVHCVLAGENATYYGMKEHGIRAASGDIIALLDSDCRPCRNWANCIAEKITAGADVVAGKTRYEPGKRFSRTFSLFSFGHVQNETNGQTKAFIVNNVAFASEVIRGTGFSNLSKRTGPGYTLSRKLRSLGYSMVYNSEQSVAHFNHGLKYHLANRIRSGHEAIDVCRLDCDRVLTETKYLKFSILCPWILAWRRLVNDLRILRKHRADLDIPLMDAPYHVAASLFVRSLEILSGTMTVLRPQFFSSRFGW